MSVMEREHAQYTALYPTSDIHDAWVWHTLSGSHYSYHGFNVWQHHDNGELEVVLRNVAEYWFPEIAGFRPFFMAESPTKGRSYFRSNLVTSYSSPLWQMKRSSRGDVQTWLVLDDQGWGTREMIRAR
jgi:hypothetical protein